MNAPGAPAYEHAVARLVKLGRGMAEAEERGAAEARARAGAPSPDARELAAIERLAGELHEKLCDSPEWSAIEDALRSSTGDSYNLMVMQLAALRDAASTARSQLPDPRERPASKWVAWAFVCLRRYFGFAKPSTYLDGPDVQALAEVLQRAGLYSTPEKAQQLLRASFKRAGEDALVFPPRFDELTG